MTMRLGWFLMAVLFALPAPAQAPNLTAAEKKTFTSIINYECFARVYREPGLLPLTSVSPPETRMQPEDVLWAQERSYYAGDAQGWLATWSDEGQAKLRDRWKAQGITEESWSADKKARRAKVKSIKLLMWVARRPYVLIQYEITSEGQGATTQTKVAAFRLVKVGIWKAVLDLENDPVYLALMEGKTDIVEDLPR